MSWNASQFTIGRCEKSMQWKKASYGDIIGINSFGESAPGDKLLEYFGFSSENVVERAEMLMKN